MSVLPPTAASIGDATANMPRQISETPHRSDKVEARRTSSEEFCAITASSSDGGESIAMDQKMQFWRKGRHLPGSRAARTGSFTEAHRHGHVVGGDGRVGKLVLLQGLADTYVNVGFVIVVEAHDTAVCADGCNEREGRGVGVIGRG